MDPDKHDLFTYSIYHGNSSTVPFRLHGNQLITTSRLNYESRDQYDINVTSVDSGNLSVTQCLTLSVVDNNDPPSDIVLPQGVCVTENQKVSKILSFHKFQIRSWFLRAVSGMQVRNL